MKQINLPDVLEIIYKWKSKIAGCGNGITVTDRMIEELNQTYGK